MLQMIKDRFNVNLRLNDSRGYYSWYHSGTPASFSITIDLENLFAPDVLSPFDSVRYEIEILKYWITGELI